MANPHAITDNNTQRDQVAQAKQALAILEKHAPAIHEQVKRKVNGWESASLVFDAIKDATARKLIAQYLRIKVGLAPKIVEKPEPEHVIAFFNYDPKTKRYATYPAPAVIASLSLCDQTTIQGIKDSVLSFTIWAKPWFMNDNHAFRVHQFLAYVVELETFDEPLIVHNSGGVIKEYFQDDENGIHMICLEQKQAADFVQSYAQSLKPAQVDLSEGTDTTQQEPAETPVAESVEAPAPVAKENAKDSAEVKVMPIQDLKVGDTFIWDKTSLKKPIRLTIMSIEYGEKGDPQHYNATLPDGEFISMKLFVPSWKYQGKQVKVVRS